MRYSNTKTASFLSRPNRFVAMVVIDGKTEAVHVKNTGRCKELLIPGATVVLTEPGLSADTLKKTVLDLIHDRARLEEMELCMRACAVSDATERITDVVLDLAGKA